MKPPSNSYVPASYAGPVRPTANGAYAPVTPLTGSRPAGGAYYALPAVHSSRHTYTQSRPLQHTYPPNYTILFICYYSPAYTGNHWAVYNDGGQFWGYDSGDVTSGDYDYDDSDGLPLGCQLSTPQAASSEGVLNLASANGTAPAPALAFATALAPGSANRSASAQRPRKLLCKPVATAEAEEQESWAQAHPGAIFGICVAAAVLATALIVGIVCWLGGACCKRKPKPQTVAGKGAAVCRG